MPATASTPSAALDSSRAARLTLRVLQAGAILIVLAALPFRQFELDRYTVPKELVLHLTAAAAGLLCLSRARQLTLFAVDYLLLAFLGLTALSAVAATNGWVAFQALGVSLSGAVLFWASRTVARAGYGRQLLATLAAAVVLAAVTALLQAYGAFTSPLFNLTRAPGGTFGNRNFIAHLVAIGLPLLLFVALEARGRFRFTLGAAGLFFCTAALFLTRSRAGWLGAGISGVFLVAEGLWRARLWQDRVFRARIIQLGVAAGIGILGAWLIPNALNWRSDSPYLESLTGMANYKDGSGRGRMIQYRQSLAMAAEHPFLGVGPANWPVHYPRFMVPNDPSFDTDDPIPTNPWPSSDWIATISERGFLAAVVFGLIGIALGLGAWMRARRVDGNAHPLRDLTIVATLLATAVVGAFDAVLLLPVPTFFLWTIVGALASVAQPARTLSLAPGRQRQAVIAAAVIASLLVMRTVARTVAMPVFDEGTAAEKQWATRIDPGSFRLHMILATEQRRRGRCKDAVPHAKAAYDLFPHYPAPWRALRACGVRLPR